MYIIKKKKHTVKHHYETKKSIAKRLPKIIEPKHKSRQSLIREADRYCSEFVRLRDKKSVTSGNPDRLTCSHLFSRNNDAVRWDEFNCNAQTLEENEEHSNNPSVYNQWFIGKYGQEKFDELYRKAHTIVKFQWYEIEAIANDYKARKEKLENNIFPV